MKSSLKSPLKSSFLAIALSAFLLAGCAGKTAEENNQFMGAILGGAAGGYVGSQFGKGEFSKWATIAGALGGAWAGSSIAKSMNQQDQSYYQSATQQAQNTPVGQSISWYNPQSGNGGTITPTREGKDTNTGGYCREYQQTITVGGKTEKAYGTACQQPDGSWKIIN